MDRAAAIAIRTAQLAGQVVDPAQVEQAVIVIRNTVHTKATPSPRGKRPSTSNPFGLPARQVKVMDLIIQGASPTEISEALGMSLMTIESYTTRARKRMGAPSKLMAALLWDRYRRTNPPTPGIPAAQPHQP